VREGRVREGTLVTSSCSTTGFAREGLLGFAVEDLAELMLA
jgi:hypothetical protein